MAFNVKKCKLMHLGPKNPDHQYQMDGKPLETTEEENDIGVTMLKNLKPSAQCSKAARTAKAVLGQISRAFHYRDRHVFMRLYTQYVRPPTSSSAHKPGHHGQKATNRCSERYR